MNVKIFRSTIYGNIECEGELFECHGLQFCLTCFDGMLNAIELSTGFRSDSVSVGDNCYEIIKERIKNRRRKSYETALKEAKKILSGNYIPFPVNRRVINIDWIKK